MRRKSRNTTYGKMPEDIRQDFLLTEISELPEKDYHSFLHKYTVNLRELVENMTEEKRNGSKTVYSLRGIYNAFPEPLCMFDDKMKIIFSNTCWKMEFPESEDKTARLSKVFSFDNYDELMLAIREKESCKIPAVIRGKKFLVNIFPYRTFEGKQMGLMFFLNKTRRDCAGNTGGRMDAIVNRSDNKPGDALTGIQSAILDSIDGFHFVLDDSVNIRYISENVREQLGFNSKELKGKSISEILTDRSSKTLNGKIADVLKGEPEIRIRFDVTLKGRKGGIRHFNLSLTKYNPAKSGKPFILGVCMNIQDQVIREKALRSAKSKAEIRDKMKSDFLANMSHEIRTPLNGIVGFSTMLDRENISAKKREFFLRLIRKSTGQLLTIVNDIIDISKIESGHLKLVYSDVDVHELLDDLSIEYNAESERMMKNDVSIKVSIAMPAKKLIINADRFRLKQVLANLLCNALKFTDEGIITIGYALENNHAVRFFVKDPGKGISESNQRTIFSRFKQTVEGQKPEYKGTGLGLAISKGLVELLGGKIGVNSEQDKGSDFYFVIPRNKP